MELKKELDKLTNQRTYLSQIKDQIAKQEAEDYYVEVFEQKILDAAKASTEPTSAIFTASEEDIKYFEYLRKIAGRSKVFIYQTNDKQSIVVRWGEMESKQYE